MPLSASFLMRQINEALKEGFGEAIDEALNEAEMKRPNEAQRCQRRQKEAKGGRYEEAQ